MAYTDSALERRKFLLHGVGFILAAAILLGTMAVCVQVAAREVSAVQIAFVRFAGSLLVLLTLRRGRSLLPSKGKHGALVLRGVLGAAAITLYYRGIEYAGAGFATLLQCTYPLWTAVFATTLLGERFHARLAAALAIGSLGIWVVLGPAADLGSATLLGGLSALVASVLAGGAVATTRHLRLSESAYLVTVYFMAIGTIFTSPALFEAMPTVSTLTVLALLGAILSAVGGQVLLHQGLGFAPAIQGSLAAAATTVFTAALLEAALLGERLSRQTILGGSLLFVAIALAASGQHRPSQPG